MVLEQSNRSRGAVSGWRNREVRMADFRAHKPDNGKIHYGVGLRGALCGVETPGRKETHYVAPVTCPECKKELRKRPS